MKKCIFLDRDGTLNKAIVKNESDTFKLRPPYKIQELEIFNDIIYLRSFCNDYLLVIISNQPDLKSRKQSYNFHNFINNQIKKKIHITDFFFCKCHPDLDKNCKCYKPSVNMAVKAIKKYNISILNSYFIGDTWRDIKLANKLKLKSILIDRGFRAKLLHEFKSNKAKPNYIIKNFSELKRIIKL